MLYNTIKIKSQTNLKSQLSLLGRREAGVIKIKPNHVQNILYVPFESGKLNIKGSPMTQPFYTHFHDDSCIKRLKMFYDLHRSSLPNLPRKYKYVESFNFEWCDVEKAWYLSKYPKYRTQKAANQKTVFFYPQGINTSQVECLVTKSIFHYNDSFIT